MPLDWHHQGDHARALVKIKVAKMEGMEAPGGCK